MPVFCAVKESRALGLNGDSALALDIHTVKVLGFHFSRRYGAGAFEQAIRQRRLTVVDMGDDAEIANIFAN